MMEKTRTFRVELPEEEFPHLVDLIDVDTGSRWIAFHEHFTPGEIINESEIEFIPQMVVDDESYFRADVAYKKSLLK